MENKKFNFVLISFTKENAILANEINSFALLDYFCDGVEEFSLEESRVDEILGERAYSGGDIPESLIDEVQAATSAQDSFTFKYFFYQNDYEINCEDFVCFIKENYSELSIISGKRDFEDWNSEWKKFYSPITVSEDIEIIPEWLAASHINKSKYQIYIYPGMGFGTGTHETTYLCLLLYSTLLSEFDGHNSCLDFGCGSGILGITAIKTCKMLTHFCDIDKSALENCTQNLILNFENQNLEGTELFLRERIRSKKYHLIFANILEHVLISEKEVVLNSLEKGGYLIVSGILNHQVDTISEHYKSLSKLKVVSKGDWSAILFKDNE